jgi:hypothetical protein
MNPQVALMILTLTCSDPVQPFRDFYSRYYVARTTEGHFRLGYTGEQLDWVYPRVADAIGDYADYRVARANLCGGQR